jgi:hypothetical protein
MNHLTLMRLAQQEQASLSPKKQNNEPLIATLRCY